MTGRKVAEDLGQAAEGYPLDVLEQLVDVTGGSYDVGRIQQVNHVMHEWLEGLGFRVQRFPVAARGDLLVATLSVGGSRPRRPRVTIVGHSDTVWPADAVGEWTMRLDRAADRISGPGVGDMKAALILAGLAAHDVAQRTGVSGIIQLVIVPDEEVGSVGSRPYLEKIAAETDLCIGLEAGKPGDGFVTSRGSVGAMRISATGSAVHVTEPGAVNALDALIPLAAAVRGLDGEAVKVSICHMAAGDSRQIAADSGMFEIDLRAQRSDDLERVVAQVRALVAESAATFAGRVTVDGGMTRPAFSATRSERPFGMLLARDAELASDGELAQEPSAKAVHERGGSDASFFANLGVPTIDGFGPVCFFNCTRDEYITISSLGDRRRRMADLIAQWLGAPG